MYIHAQNRNITTAVGYNLVQAMYMYSVSIKNRDYYDRKLRYDPSKKSVHLMKVEY